MFEAVRGCDVPMCDVRCASVRRSCPSPPHTTLPHDCSADVLLALLNLAMNGGTGASTNNWKPSTELYRAHVTFGVGVRHHVVRTKVRVELAPPPVCPSAPSATKSASNACKHSRLNPQSGESPAAASQIVSCTVHILTFVDLHKSGAPVMFRVTPGYRMQTQRAARRQVGWLNRTGGDNCRPQLTEHCPGVSVRREVDGQGAGVHSSTLATLHSVSHHHSDEFEWQRSLRRRYTAVPLAIDRAITLVRLAMVVCVGLNFPPRRQPHCPPGSSPV